MLLLDIFRFQGEGRPCSPSPLPEYPENQKEESMKKFYMKDGMRVLALYDLHLKTEPVATPLGWVPDISESVYTVLNFAKDWKPDVTILGGDFLDLDEVSHWVANNSIRIEGKRLRHNLELGNLILNKIDEFTRRKKVYIVGNHCARLGWYLNQHPVLEGMFSLEGCLRLRDRGYEVIPEGGRYKLGKAYFIHGWYTNKYHASKTVDVMGENVFYSHTHDIQVHTKPNADEQPIMGHSLGSLSDLAPHYMRGRPTKGLHSFGAFYFSRDGSFTPYVPILINGKFWWNGKLYTPEGVKDALHKRT